MSLWVVNIHGEIEGDYEIIGKYEPTRTGKWIDAGHFFERSWATCSECKECVGQRTDNDGWGFSIKFLKYCPNCGAKMEGVSE